MAEVRTGFMFVAGPFTAPEPTLARIDEFTGPMADLFPMRHHWFPNPFCAPQSGHCQVIPLHDMPQKFSSMQSWQMAKPQRHCQQNGTLAPQQLQTVSRARLRRSRQDNETFSGSSFIACLLRFSAHRPSFSPGPSRDGWICFHENFIFAQETAGIHRPQSTIPSPSSRNSRDSA